MTGLPLPTPQTLTLAKATAAFARLEPHSPSTKPRTETRPYVTLRLSLIWLDLAGLGRFSGNAHATASRRFRQGRVEGRRPARSPRPRPRAASRCCGRYEEDSV